MRAARAVAHTNIALIKYWGKRPGDPDQNLPAVGSLSLTLERLRSETTVRPGERDSFQLDGHSDPAAAAKVARHLDRVWRSANPGPRPPCAVDSTNHLPTAAGLASSASGFAALTLAAAAAFELDLDRGALSALARRGSGSAARSLWGGFVRLGRGERADGADCRARPLFPADHWDLRLLVVHTAKGPKPIGSTDGMQRSADTSPYYPAWVATSEADLERGERALADRDLAALGAVMEHSCFKMHACMLATVPPLIYWNGTTLAAIHEVWAARRAGLEAYVTSDAGPHVKVLCRPDLAAELAARLAAVPGVHAVDTLAPGPDARVELLP
ncbi:MAG: diphosphomevalonate decarboxylase [Nannocystis sp.]|uniref:diphosphomevalonate decarboxylase n=1 Tax=Nannocystis sp. TaxID=1962667 RepID=UPI002428B489|nr:diphosphomevalonate decarboxylase [Nannocystis sp.]MBK9754442.1 diphosphomevalonate decarboxylase [Nannocystis sp.]